MKNYADYFKDIPRYYLLFGETQYLKKETQKAQESFQKALKLDISYSEAYKYFRLVFERRGQATEAFEAVQNALKFTPNDSEAWIELANLYYRTENTLDAIVSLQQAIKYKPKLILASACWAPIKHHCAGRSKKIA